MLISETVSSVRPCGGRIRVGSEPVSLASSFWVRVSSSRISSGSISVRRGWFQVWLATSWPSFAILRTVSGYFSMCFLPSRKKVAGTSSRFSRSRRAGVSLPGPPSKVSAMHLATAQSTSPLASFTRAPGFPSPPASWARARSSAGATVPGVQEVSAVRAASARAATAVRRMRCGRRVRGSACVSVFTPCIDGVHSRTVAPRPEGFPHPAPDPEEAR